MAEGGGLLNRYRLVKAYRGFESLRLRQKSLRRAGALGADIMPAILSLGGSDQSIEVNLI